ncbi:MAG TPA: histidinol phosphate phosphatase domain-containing protein [Syntrophobacteria bacterium]|nr:histidinol phosphate phosphatase domain-containing protein [Syntrophobacteria bacterium]
MIDLHTHTLFSDGELVRRAESAGYRFMAVTDHADRSNLDPIIPRLVRAVAEINRHNRVQTLAGIELTHAPPATIGPLATEARRLGASIVVVHGETVVEPVTLGTNRAALEADIDIPAHPGLLNEEEAALAARRGILLEISGRKGHSFTNGHVARMAQKTGTGLVLNSDAHGPGDLLSRETARRIVLGAGLDDAAFAAMIHISQALVERRRDARAS